MPPHDPATAPRKNGAVWWKRQNRHVISVSTLLVALVGGISGGVLGTWLQIHHEREEAFRERLITAADDFSTGLLQAIIGLDATRTTCVDHAFLYPPNTNQLMFRNPKNGEMPAESAEALRESRKLIREVEARRARISLLFGPVSMTDLSTTMAVLALEEAQHALEEPPVPDFKKFNTEMSEAREEHKRFNKQALAEIRGRPWGRRLRQVWNRVRKAPPSSAA
jgi:hypothetical protein